MKESLINYVDGIEVYNSLHNDKQYPAFHLFRKLKKLRKKNNTIKAFFGEDFHNGVNSDTAIYVTAEKLEEKDILLALKNGNYYIKNKYFTYYPDGRFEYIGRIFFPYMKSFFVEVLQYLNPKVGKVIYYLPYSSRIKQKLYQFLKLFFGRI